MRLLVVACILSSACAASVQTRDADHIALLQTRSDSVALDDDVVNDDADKVDDDEMKDQKMASEDAGCSLKCTKRYNKFTKKGKWAKKGFKKVCVKTTVCGECSFCQEEPSTNPDGDDGEEEPAEEDAGEDSGDDAEEEPVDAEEEVEDEPVDEDEDEDVNEEPVDADEEVEEEPVDAEEEVEEPAEEEEAPAPAPAPAPTPSFKKVQDDRYWGCARKGMGNLHGFGHRTAQDCFAATLKDPACKGKFDYNQRYNGQCKCVTQDGCTGLRGLRGYVAYEEVAEPSFSKVQGDRYWGCARKGMGNLHGFGHKTAEDCFAATLKDPACKGQFDYNQGYNGQCKCVTQDGCTGLRGLRGYVAYKSDAA